MLMARKKLVGVRVAALAADGFEQVEMTVPVEYLRKHGAEVEVVSIHPGSIRGMNGLMPGKKVDVDRTLLTADPNDYDALLLPGGTVNPDTLRQSDRALDFVRDFDRAGKPIAVICHGPWLLVSAGLVRGRRLTSWPGIRDDIRNAGGLWESKSVVRSGNWVTSRGPQDLRKFRKAMLAHFSEHCAPAHENGDGGVKGWLAGGLALATIVIGIRRALSRSNGQPEPSVAERVTPPPAPGPERATPTGAPSGV